MVRLLERSGYEVLLAENGHAALRLLASSVVDVIVSDVMMPGMGGVELYQRLPADLQARMVLCTGAFSLIERVPAGVPVLEKPINFPVLMETLARVSAMG